MPKPQERPAAKKAAPAAKAVPKPKPLAVKAKPMAKPAPAVAKAKPVATAKPAKVPTKATKPAPAAAKAKAPVSKAAPAPKSTPAPKSNPAKAAKPAPAKAPAPAVKAKTPAAKPAAAPKPVAAKAKPVAKTAEKVVKAAAKPAEAKVAAKPIAKVPPAVAEKPKTVAKAAPAAKPATPSAPAARTSGEGIAKPKLATAPSVKPAKPETKPVVVLKPVIEKPLKPAKIIAAPVSSSKVVKMSKQTEHANGHAANGNLKCPFNAEELDQWRKLLVSRRAEISSDIDALEKDAMEAEDGHTTPLHAAERGSDADLQDVSLGLAGEEKDLLWQIDRAIRKIDLAAPLPFGLCEHTREAIPKLRLQLIPWTPLSIEGATHLEQSGLTVEDLLIDD